MHIRKGLNGNGGGLSLTAHIAGYVQLTAAEEALLLAAVRERQLRKKQYLLEEGQVCQAQWYVQSGCLYAYDLNEKGEEHIIKFALENGWISDLHSYLTGSPARLNIQAAEPCRVWEVNKKALDELYLAVPALERFFRITLENAFVAMQDRMLAAISQTAEERYARLVQATPQLEQRIPQYMLASYLGITPEFLSKIKKKHYAGS